jgi:hypothetical protein
MKTHVIAIGAVAVTLMIASVVSAQMMGGGMMKGGQGEMTGMERGQTEMMQAMGQMREMLHTMMRHLQNLAQDQQTKGEMGAMIKDIPLQDIRRTPIEGKE